MCLAVLAIQAHPRFPLVIAANRDEYFARPAAPMAWWTDAGTALLAGRDLSAGGTWFGLTQAGRLALLTNVREPARHNPGAPSRGALVTGWLSSELGAEAYAASLGCDHNGFNLITADLLRGHWHALSNRSAGPTQLGPGLHALSNADLQTPWPKTQALRGAAAQALVQASSVEHLSELLFSALASTTEAPDEALPDTGVGLARERLLSPCFVRITDPANREQAVYGTRCSTVLISEWVLGRLQTRVIERVADAGGQWGLPVEHRLTDWPPNRVVVA